VLQRSVEPATQVGHSAIGLSGSVRLFLITGIFGARPNKLKLYLIEILMRSAKYTTTPAWFEEEGKGPLKSSAIRQTV
jgi:hypothetical protein